MITAVSDRLAAEKGGIIPDDPGFAGRGDQFGGTADADARPI